MTHKVTVEQIWTAYRYLKSYAYEENLNLFLKVKLSRFEDQHLLRWFGEQMYMDGQLSTEDTAPLEQFLELLDSDEFVDHPFKRIQTVLNSEDPSNHPEFVVWTKKITYRLLPKAIQVNSEIGSPDSDPTFMTNKKAASEYNVLGVNYFVDAPIEIHLLEMLWSLLVGYHLDERLEPTCLGNRLSPQAKKFREEFYNRSSVTRSTSGLFKRYVEQYNDWRDKAIDTAKQCLAEKRNVAIFSMDLKSYFYWIEPDLEQIDELIRSADADANSRDFELRLSQILERIHVAYRDGIRHSLRTSHADIDGSNCGIPIGFSSSSILANWHLHSFDKRLSSSVPRLRYYGRYVDDVLMVFDNPEVEEEKDPRQIVSEFVKRYFKGIIVRARGAEERRSGDYRLSQRYHGHFVQADKFLLHYFDKDYTSAGIDVFKRELDDLSSSFRFLSDDHFTSDMDKFAYDILYDGSVHKLRSIVGLAENESGLSRYLSSQIIAHRLCEIEAVDSIAGQLNQFFSGLNALKFSRLWEKVFSYAVIKGLPDLSEALFGTFSDLIGRMVFAGESSHDVSSRIRVDLREYLSISLSLPLSLLDLADQNVMERVSTSPVQREFMLSEGVLENAINLRSSNLLRHPYVTWPLLNYTDFLGDLTDPAFYNSDCSVSLDRLSISLSPRFVHFDEWQLLLVVQNSRSESLPSAPTCLLEDAIGPYRELYFDDEFPIATERFGNESSLKLSQIKIDGFTSRRPSEADSKLRVAVANTMVSERNIKDACRKNGKPNVTLKRQKALYSILDEAEKNRVDLLVMPEVSIPVSWLPFMVAYSRRHQIGLVFGLEHWVIKDTAFNLIVEVFPFRIADTYRSCALNMRLKNHYSPAESKMLENYGLKSGEPSPDEWRYNLVEWAGLKLTSYNCYELANIEHRSIFRSELQLLLACVWNKDTAYYDHVLESAVRDLFCFVVQANTSQFGGSCVLQPTKSITMPIIKVKGGDNNCILTTDLDIPALKAAQYERLRDPQSQFKPTPPGYDKSKAESG